MKEIGLNDAMNLIDRMVANNIRFFNVSGQDIQIFYKCLEALRNSVEEKKEIKLTKK